MQRSATLSAFPLATLVVNLTGCLLIGIVIGLIDARQMFSAEMRLFIVVGLLGSFTTYSTFAYETFALLRDADYLRASGTVLLHLILGLLFVGVGYVAASR